MQRKENAAMKIKQTLHFNDKNLNDLNIEGKRNHCSKLSRKNELRNKSRPKRTISVYLNKKQ